MRSFIIKAGYVPIFRTELKDLDGVTHPRINTSGFALRGEANIYAKGIWIGISLEWLRVKQKLYGIDMRVYDEETFDPLTFDYNSLTPRDYNFTYDFIEFMPTFKYLTLSGFYGGLGFSARYLIKASVPSAEDGWTWGKPKKKVDFWTHLVIGYLVPVSKSVVFNFESRFGWNVTKNQFEKWADKDENNKIRRSYDCAFYAGVGYRMKFDPLKEKKK